MIDIDGIGKINGGSVIASGGAAMDCSISDQSGQNIIAYSTERIEEGTRIVLKDKNGEEMISHEPLRSCSLDRKSVV